MSQSASKLRSSHHPTGLGQKGQIVVEYVLLLVIGVMVATLITSKMVSRSPNSPGFVIVKWLSIIQEVGKDTPDDLNAKASP